VDDYVFLSGSLGEILKTFIKTGNSNFQVGFVCK